MINGTGVVRIGVQALWDAPGLRQEARKQADFPVRKQCRRLRGARRVPEPCKAHRRFRKDRHRAQSPEGGEARVKTDAREGADKNPVPLADTRL